jgi:hypothetical protein
LNTIEEILNRHLYILTISLKPLHANYIGCFAPIERYVVD